MNKSVHDNTKSLIFENYKIVRANFLYSTQFDAWCIKEYIFVLYLIWHVYALDKIVYHLLHCSLYIYTCLNENINKGEGGEKRYVEREIVKR